MTAQPNREYFVPVFNLTTRKLSIYRQSSDDLNHAAIAARRRFPGCRIHTPLDAMPAPHEVAALENLHRLPLKQRARFVKEW